LTGQVSTFLTKDELVPVAGSFGVWNQDFEMRPIIVFYKKPYRERNDIASFLRRHIFLMLYMGTIGQGDSGD